MTGHLRNRSENAANQRCTRGEIKRFIDVEKKTVGQMIRLWLVSTAEFVLVLCQPSA